MSFLPFVDLIKVVHMSSTLPVLLEDEQLLSPGIFWMLSFICEDNVPFPAMIVDGVQLPGCVVMCITSLSILF